MADRRFETQEIEVKTAQRRGAGLLWFPIALVLALAAGGLTGILSAFYVNNSRAATEVAALATYRPSVVTKVYADDGETVIAEFALEKRIPLEEKEIPQRLEDAILSIEDNRFYNHVGIDPQRIGGVIYKNITTGTMEGGSTLTQQVAKNLFLSKEQTFTRKFNEWLMALQIERFYTKRQILQMYVNHIFLGAGAYGFEAAAQTYFGKSTKDLSVEEAALLAAIPKSPSEYAPTRSMERAKERRNLVIEQMARYGKITEAEANAAKVKPIALAPSAYSNAQPKSNPWDYPVEEVRRYLEDKYTTRVAQGGLQVYTTINIEAQKLATRVVRERLRNFDRGRAWRSEYINTLLDDNGQEITDAKQIGKKLEAFRHADWYGDQYEKGDFIKGLVMSVDKAKNEAYVRFGRYNAVVTSKDMGKSGKQPKDELRAGFLPEFEVIEVDETNQRLKVALSQVPGVQAAMTTINAKTGEIVAMVGGYDFATNKFNNATQGLRQTGSCYKPFIYTAALEWGMTPEMPVSGAPIKRGRWQPHNYDGSLSHGNVPMKQALAKSYNIAAVRLLDQVSVQTGAQMVRRFGITAPMSPNLSSALGASEAPLIEMVSAYSAFPNKGVRVEPHLIRRVLDRDGNVVEEWKKTTYKVTSEYVAGSMVEMMRAVTSAGGTAAGANAGGNPVAGKTGTVNDHTDVWFIGFTPTYVTGVWMGNPEKKESLGSYMTGGHGALPYFNAFMPAFMKGKPSERFYETPKMPADIKELNERRKREERELLEKAEAEGLSLPRGNIGVRRSSGSSSRSSNGNAPMPLSPDSPVEVTAPKIDPPSNTNDDDKRPTAPAAPKSSEPKRPDAPTRRAESSSDDVRPRTVEAPKKKGKRGDDEP